MQQFGWRKNGSVQDWLFAEGYRFDFFQAVRLLEKMAESNSGLSETSVSRYSRRNFSFDSNLENIQLRSRVNFAFPPSEIHEVKRISETPFQAEITANFLGLAGSQGPLPDVFAELLLERKKYHDTGFSDFLDIFHHRLLSLMYHVRLRHRLWLEWKRPEDGRQAKYIYAFAGLGLPELQGRMQVPDSTVLAYAGLLWQRPRSAIGLQRILEDHFGAKVVIKPMVGSWKKIESDDWTRLGQSGNSQILGRSATVGRKFWDQQGRFDISFHDLSIEQFRSFLPGGTKHGALQDLVRFYTNDRFAFYVELKLCAKDVPVTRLGSSQLGWTSWIKKKTTESARGITIKGRTENVAISGR